MEMEKETTRKRDEIRVSIDSKKLWQSSNMLYFMQFGIENNRGVL